MVQGHRYHFVYAWLLITFWSWNKDNIWQRDAIIMCHGLPSHPYDHTPAGCQKLLREGYVLIFVNYYGTWGSDGICTFENCVDSILKTIEFVVLWQGCESRSDTMYKRKMRRIVLAWGSFWASVALVAGAKSPHVQDIIACSPVINRKEHNTIYPESNLNELARFLATAYKNVRRCSPDAMDRLKSGLLDINPGEYVDVLKDKNICLIHAKSDPQISYAYTKVFLKRLRKWKWHHVSYSPAIGRHIILFLFDVPRIHRQIKKFLRRDAVAI